MKKDYCLDSSRPVAFRQACSRKEYKTSRAAVLSIEKLKERKLKINYLVNEQE